MSDVFISYAREDCKRANSLSTILEKEGLKVSYDKDLRPGELIRASIQKKIREAGRVVVLWSQSSLESDWVIGEALYARELNKLVPILLDEVDPPIDFRSIHTADLTTWDGLDCDYIKATLLPVLHHAGSHPPETASTKLIELPLSMLNDRDLEPGKVFRDGMGDAMKGPKMMVIPAGKFSIGSKVGEAERQPVEGPRQQISIPNKFAMSIFPVAFREFDLFVNSEKGVLPYDQGWGRDDRPVINVSLHDAINYCHWLSNATGRTYRLPSESEWEYAARGNTNTRYWWGDDMGKENAHCDGCDLEWDTGMTLPVGMFQANPFGLYDMHGNVFEWCQDRWHASYAGIPEDGSAWMNGLNEEHVIRGGSWIDFPKHLRSANRYKWHKDYKEDFLGFRIVREL